MARPIKILITGCAGFIGHHVLEHLLKNTDWEIVTLDRLNVSGNHNRFTDLEIWPEQGHRVRTVVHDLRCAINEAVAKDIGYVDYILHMAASTHVDRSITDPMGFVLDNVVATTNILEFSRKQNELSQQEDFIPPVLRFMYFSTDEVFGPAPGTTVYKEWDRYNSGNPYAAAKAGGEEMALAYANTYRIPVIITHTMNVVSERQHPEKFVPMTVKKIMNGEKILIHSDKTKTKSGSRFWIHARNVAQALSFVIKETEGMEFDQGSHAWKFNIVGEKEMSNLEIAKFIFGVLKEHGLTKTEELDYEMIDFHSSRPGHDLRYGLDGSKLKSLGWVPPTTFDESFKKTIEWMIKPEHQKWLG